MLLNIFVIRLIYSMIQMNSNFVIFIVKLHNKLHFGFSKCSVLFVLNNRLKRISDKHQTIINDNGKIFISYIKKSTPQIYI